MDNENPNRWSELLRGIQEQERAAEDAFGAFFQPRVLAMAAVRLRDYEAARDLAQETLLAVLLAIREGRVREPEKLPAFVAGTARNLINNHIRSRGQNRETVPLEPDTPAADCLPDAVELDEQRGLVRAGLEQLEPMDKKILQLTLVEGMNPREIAPIVGLSTENVRARKSRAVKSVIADIQKRSRKRL